MLDAVHSLPQPYLAGRMAWIVGRDRLAPTCYDTDARAIWLAGYDHAQDDAETIGRLIES